ncbi:MAG: hypothetical protein K2H01_03270 [Ruminococcus sp.]|nr:hypothetical protein [Ruminococcus sp.]
MNHEEKEAQCRGYYANMDNLRYRVSDMLRNGISIKDVISEIKKDKYCTRLQKLYVKQEMHLE